MVYCDNSYGSYSTLASARTACASDNNCGAFYDAACDNTGYKLCPISSVAKPCQTCTSCIYPKNGMLPMSILRKYYDIIDILHKNGKKTQKFCTIYY